MAFLFTNREAEVTDNRYMKVSYDENMVNGAVVDGDITAGSIAGLIDNDPTTGLEYDANSTWTKYITCDLLQMRKNVTVTSFFSATRPSTGTVTATLQTSTDNSVWTDVASVEGGGTESFKNYSALLAKVRYIRLKMVSTYTGTTAHPCRWLWLKVYGE